MYYPQFAMSSSEKTYIKQNSFIDIHHHKTLGDIIPQIRNLKDRLHTLPLSNYKKKIVKSACSELLDPESINKNLTPFKLYSYNLDEINQLKMRIFQGIYFIDSDTKRSLKDSN